MPLKKFAVENFRRINKFSKTISVDSDKSISIRSFLISAISLDVSHINNALESEDVISTIRCLKKLNVKIIKKNPGKYLVYGKGLGSLNCKKKTVLNCENSGTLSRLLIGILSTTPNIDVIIKGDHSLNKRNMKKLIELMNSFGAEFSPIRKMNFPLRLISSEIPLGIEYKAGVSAQLKSAAILAGLNSYGQTFIEEKIKSRDHTENMLRANKKSISLKKGNTNMIKIHGKNQLQRINITIPGDPSSAAFFCALAILKTNCKLKIKNVQLNKTRIGFYEILKKSGAKIKFTNIKLKNGERIGDISVKSSKLKPLRASKLFYPKTADEYPILFVIASLTKGSSVFEGISDLANKESNRILEMKKILNKIGIKFLYSKGKVKIYGAVKKDYKNLKITVPKLGDHRICMSTLILSLLTGVKVRINNFETVNTSAPSFLKLVKKIGGKFEIKK